MSTWGPRARKAALVAGGSLVLHQLRYVVSYGDRAPERLAHDGHAYLSVVTPLVAALVVLAVARALQLVCGRCRAATATRSGPLWRTWAFASLAPLAVYVLQELLEGVLSTGHPDGLAAIFAGSGWSAFLCAAPVGVLVALALEGAGVVAPWPPEHAPLTVLVLPCTGLRAPLRPWRPVLDPVATLLAGRGPPPRSSCDRARRRRANRFLGGFSK
jgi:hypothetical protein